MSTDTEDIQSILWRYLKISINACYRCIEKQPLPFGFMSLFFFLYLFLPSQYFYYLLYSSPIIVSIAVFIQIYLPKELIGIESAAKTNDKSPLGLKSSENGDVVVKRHGKPVIQSQMSRRRNFRDKNIQFDTEGGSKEDRGIVLATTRNDALFFEEKSSNLLNHTDINSDQKTVISADIHLKEDLVGKPSSSEIIEEKEGNSSDKCDSISISSSLPSMVDLLSDNAASGKKSEKSNPNNGGETEVESSEDDFEDEEQAKTDRNKAVEWTADDQQNLMDLGDSELERNKRLESLIAKRRARKLFKMAIEKSLMAQGNTSSSHIAPIIIAKNNLLNIPSNNDVMESLQMPGSAPSVLLPTRNPFDLPYDPLEEKPDLTADSFQQEFAATNQKDIMFCRHESFCWGPSFPLDYSQDQQDPKFCPFGPEKTNEIGLRRRYRYRTRSDMSDHDLLIDELMSQESDSMSHTVSATDLVELGNEAPKKRANSVDCRREEDIENGASVTKTKPDEIENSHDTESRSADRSEILMETDSVKDISTGPCSVASSEASDLSFQTNIPENIPKPSDGINSNFHQKLSDRVRNSLTCSIPIPIPVPPYDMSPSNEKPKMEEFMFYRQRAGHCHTPAHSIASDLQVEVSEVGSPTPQIEVGNLSSADAESLTYDGDVEKEITSGSEEMWGLSTCHLAGVEENESRSKGVHEISEEDIVEVGFSAIKKNLGNQEKAPEQDAKNSANIESKVKENVKQVVEEVQRFENSLDASSPANAEMAIVSLMETDSHSEPHSGKPKELSNPPEMSKEDIKATPNADSQGVKTQDNGQNSKPTEDRDGEADIHNKQKALVDLSRHSAKIISESAGSSEMTKLMPAELRRSEKTEKVIENIEFSKSIEENPEKVKEQKDTGSSSKPIDLEESSESAESSEQVENTPEVRALRENQSFGNLSISSQLTELGGERVPSDSSSSSSPRSVLPGKIQTDQVPSSISDVPVVIDPALPVDNRIRTGSLDETPPGNLTLTATIALPQSTQLVDTIDHPSTSSDSGKSKEAGDPPGKFSGETSHANNVKDPSVNENEVNKKLKSVTGSEAESVSSITNEASGETPKPKEVSASKSIEDIGESKLTKGESIVGTSDLKDVKESLSSIKGIEESKIPPKPYDIKGKLEVIESSIQAAESKNHNETPVTSVQEEPSNPPLKKSTAEPLKMSLPPLSTSSTPPKSTAEDLFGNKKAGNPKKYPSEPSTPRGKKTIPEFADDHNVGETLLKELSSKDFTLNQKGKERSSSEKSLDEKTVKESEKSRVEEPHLPKSMDESAVISKVNETVPEERKNIGNFLADEPATEASNPVPKSTAENAGIGKENETSAKETHNKENLNEQYNVKVPQKSSLDLPPKYNVKVPQKSSLDLPPKLLPQESKEVNKVVGDDKNKKEKSVEQTIGVEPQKSTTAEIDVLHKKNEKIAKEMRSEESLLGQKNVEDSQKHTSDLPPKLPPQESTKEPKEVVTNDANKKNNSVDQPNLVEPKKCTTEASSLPPEKSTTGVDVIHKEKENVAKETTNNENVIDQKNVAAEPSKPLPQESAKEAATAAKVDEKISKETSNKEDLTNKKNVVDASKSDENNVSLKAKDEIKNEPNAHNVNNVKADKSTNDSDAVDKSKQVESEAKVTKQETNTKAS